MVIERKRDKKLTQKKKKQHTRDETNLIGKARPAQYKVWSECSTTSLAVAGGCGLKYHRPNTDRTQTKSQLVNSSWM